MTTPPNQETDSFVNQHAEEQEAQTSRKGVLGLISNEVVGYRIVPDEHNWTVFLLCRYGLNRMFAGEEYFRPLAYCRSLESAAQWILNRDFWMQSGMFELTEAMWRAKEEVQKAIHTLLAAHLTSGAVSLPNRASLLEDHMGLEVALYGYTPFDSSSS